MSACGLTTRRVVGPAVDEGVEEATERDVAKDIEALLSTPEMRASIEEIARALLDGAREELGQAEWEALIHARSADLVEGMAPALARSLETDIGPAMRRELARAIELSLAKLAAPGTKAQFADIAGAVTTAVTDTLLLAPADPAHPPLRRATEHVMLGLGDALEGELGTSLHAFLRRERLAIARDIERSVDPLSWVFVGLTAVLAPAVLVLALLSWRKARAARRHALAARLLARACADRASLDALVERVEIEGNAELAKYLRELGRER